MMPSSAPTTQAPSTMASISRWGSSSRIMRSLKVPGSLSSALQITYLGPPAALAVKSHFMPVGKPAPPMPRRPEAFRVSTVSVRPAAASPPSRRRSTPYRSSGVS